MTNKEEAIREARRTLAAAIRTCASDRKAVDQLEKIIDQARHAVRRLKKTALRRADEHDPLAGTLRRAANLYGISYVELNRLVRTGKIPFHQTRGAWRRVFFADVEKYLRSQQVRVTDHARARVQEILARERARDEKRKAQPV